MKLYITTDGLYVGTQKEAGKGYEQVEVPTDKAGLIDYLNDNCRSPQAKLQEYGEEKVLDQMLGLTDHPLPTRSFTPEQVDAMFADPVAKPPMARDAVCASVAQYEGTDLGYVALEVAARFKALADRQELLG